METLAQQYLDVYERAVADVRAGADNIDHVSSAHASAAVMVNR